MVAMVVVVLVGVLLVSKLSPGIRARLPPFL